jgi:mannose-6-phosphate isomerase-like protein (cupin superfamily)
VYEASLAGLAVGRPDGSFVLAEWADAGETSRERPIAPLHAHRSEDEAWYVLEGRLGLVAGEDELELTTGGAVVVPAGTPHAYWNASAEPARYLLVMGPETYRLVQAIHAEERRDAESMRELFRAHDAELLA